MNGHRSRHPPRGKVVAGPRTDAEVAKSRRVSEFKANNASAGSGGAHPILAAVTPKSTRISADTNGVNFVRGWKSNSVATCSDCHGATRTGPRGPHGSANDYLLQSLDTSAVTLSTSGRTLGTPAYTSLTNTAVFCLNCHAADTYGNGDGGGGGAGTAQSNAGNRWGHGTVNGFGGTCDPANANVEGNGCKNCHCGKGSTLGTTKGTHSSNAPVGSSSQSGVGFINGNCWSAAPDATNCYSNKNNATGWSTCGKAPHASSDRGFKRNFAEIMNPLAKILGLDGSVFRSAEGQEGISVLVETVNKQQRILNDGNSELREIRRMIRQAE